MHAGRAVDVTFDDPNLVSCAGLEPVMRLAESCDLPGIVAEKVHLPTSVGSNPAGKISAIVAGMVLYPVLSRLSRSRGELRRVIEKALTLLTLLGVAAALVLALFAERIVGFVYPAQAYADNLQRHPGGILVVGRQRRSCPAPTPSAQRSSRERRLSLSTRPSV